MTRLAILDLDGTLLDTLDDLAASVNHALAEVGRPPRSRLEIEAFVGEGARLLLERAVAPHGELAPAALAAWWRHYEAHCLDRTRPFPGVPELLTRSGRQLAVHTNKPGRLARRILAGLGLLDRFASVTGGDEAPKKPDPAGTLEIMRRLGARPEETVFVGDSPTDVRTARNAGVTMVAVTWGFRPLEELRAAGAVHVVDRVAGLRAWLE
ncbi:MAG TPA: HAD-IA family hydrolase [Anaeromyxobacteraceae bacterium]|nr:HAD-IA family hydrolase [Anaeromyxobacteraceae bacterium]